jgi:hypothetical protein
MGAVGTRASAGGKLDAGHGEPLNWGALYTKIATCFGWTWEYIDEFVTVPRLKRWRSTGGVHPPLQELFAAFVGYKAPATRTRPKRRTTPRRCCRI